MSNENIEHFIMVIIGLLFILCYIYVTIYLIESNNNKYETSFVIRSGRGLIMIECINTKK